MNFQAMKQEIKTKGEKREGVSAMQIVCLSAETIYDYPHKRYGATVHCSFKHLKFSVSKKIFSLHIQVSGLWLHISSQEAPQV